MKLTSRGEKQAVAAGKALKTYVDPTTGEPLKPTCLFVSLLCRAQMTLELMSETMGLRATGGDGYSLPAVSSWRLNERHYGALCGMSKLEAESKFGVSVLSEWRNSWDTPPPPMDLDTLSTWRRAVHCQTETHFTDPSGSEVRVLKEGRIPPLGSSFAEPGADLEPPRPNEYTPSSTNWRDLMAAKMPASESLKDTCERVLPIWSNGIAPRLARGETVLLVAHANTIRSILFHVDPENVNEETMKGVKIPSAAPLIVRFEDREGEGLVNVGDVCERTGIKGEWVENDEIAEVRVPTSACILLNSNVVSSQLSFCTIVGQSALEHEIA